MNFYKFLLIFAIASYGNVWGDTIEEHLDDIIKLRESISKLKLKIAKSEANVEKMEKDLIADHSNFNTSEQEKSDKIKKENLNIKELSKETNEINDKIKNKSGNSKDLSSETPPKENSEDVSELEENTDETTASELANSSETQDTTEALTDVN
jgi:hypothetical protein